MTDRDPLLEHTFGPPHVAAADLHELRIWTHKHTALSMNAASITGRELCYATDNTWHLRALTNEKVLASPGLRPRMYGGKVLHAESTLETVIAVADGREAIGTKPRPTKNLESIWPAQFMSWFTWVNAACDLAEMAGITIGHASEIRANRAPLGGHYVSPALFMLLVRESASPYTSAVAGALSEGVSDIDLWKFACTVAPDPQWFNGMGEFKREWLRQFPGGQLAMWLRAVVCNGWMTSYQIAKYMGLDLPVGARSTEQGWI